MAVILRNYLGEVVYTEELGERSAGNQAFLIPASDISAGIYALELMVGSQVYPYKINLVK